MGIFQATDVVEMAMELEKSGEIFYKAVAERSASPEVAELFRDLAEDERDHYEAYEKLAKTSWEQPLMTDDEWDQYMMYLQATIQGSFFEGSDKALSLAEQAADEKEALRMAVAFEKETMLFFHDLHDMVSGADKKVVERIIAEEKTHLHRLAGMI